MGGRGSVTVFLALVLSLLVALVAACLASVQQAAARVQIANGADIGLYSLFAQYDPCLLEEFDLFYVDLGYGQEEFQLSRAYDTVVDYMEPVLQQNYQKLKIKTGGITGYTLATDGQGQSLKEQVAAYMGATLGAQGVQALLEKISREKDSVENQERTMEEAEAGNTMEDYDRALEEAAREQENREQENQEQEVPGGDGIQEVPIEPVEPAEPVENPIDTIRRVQNMGVLELVVKDPGNISQKSADLSGLASRRELQQGLGFVNSGELSMGDQILFQEYMLERLGNYRQPAGSGLLSYPMEYVIGGRESDVENLKAVANRLLLIREASNFVYLMGDGSSRTQSHALAAAIAAALLVPMAEGLIEMVLLACWAYGESLLDVRCLLDGGRIPLGKTAATWQLSLENLPRILENLDSRANGGEEGMSYTDYLRILLYLDNPRDQTMAYIDAFELTMRGKETYENFRMDYCMAAMEVAIDVNANGRKTYEVKRQYAYYPME